MLMNNELQNEIKKMCYDIFDLIHLKYPRRKGMIFQFRCVDGKGYEGSTIDIGINGGAKFKPFYYQESGMPQNDSCGLKETVDKHRKVLYSIWEQIHSDYPNNKLRTFNLFYNGTDRIVEICKNAIGNKSKRKSRLYIPF